MKNKFLLILLAVFLLLLMGCETFIHQYKYEDISENVEKVEIVNYESDGTVSMIYKELKYEEGLSLLYDYSGLYFDADMPILGGPKSHRGKAIRVYYKDEKCRIFTAHGETTQSFALCIESEYLEIIDKYLK